MRLASRSFAAFALGAALACSSSPSTLVDAGPDAVATDAANTSFPTTGVVVARSDAQTRFYSVAGLASGDFVAGGFFSDNPVTLGSIGLTSPSTGLSVSNGLVTSFSPPGRSGGPKGSAA